MPSFISVLCIASHLKVTNRICGIETGLSLWGGSFSFQGNFSAMNMRLTIYAKLSTM